ncbi:AbiV family abortive infection protein [Maribacter sp. MAR_2009_72]|uniref:AbiV family abortive infection protein n=1 Tax=Maribacter sp. MAR_2009_72 TaxID=1250050 RepID=UPI00119953D7|nr:AbiV family abortive infection protein [Maribacter sp. MAR_2009_72]TVZ13944.1 AbiV family abortive infection protein [Maribacter sp. MAR_2009_72]
MNSEFYLTGYKETLQNASDLLLIANNSGELKKYGVAVSLSILSAEESIKALFIIQQSIDPKAKVSDFDKIFRNHKIKHEYLHDFIRTIMKYCYDLIDEYEKYIPNRKEKRAFERKNPKITARMNWIKENQKFSDDMYQLIGWLEDANSKKNKGLYVDIERNNWELPRNTSENKYLKSIGNAKDILEYVKFATDILSEIHFKSPIK